MPPTLTARKAPSVVRHPLPPRIHRRHPGQEGRLRRKGFGKNSLTGLLLYFLHGVAMAVWTLGISAGGIGTARAQATSQIEPGDTGPREQRQIITEKVTMGVRVGISDHRNEETFRKYEFFLNLALPWAWRSQSGWVLSTHIDLTGAALNGGGVTGFLGSAGPALELEREGGRIVLEGGMSPAYLAEDRFGKEDLSGHFQLLSHVGLSLLILRGLAVAYEFQHMSNAGLQQPNPGLNVHSLELSYRF